jgi:hypothetical protein
VNVDDFDWHKMTSAEEDGVGYTFVLDVSEDTIPDVAADHRGTLIRIAKPGWSWLAREFVDKKGRREWTWWDIGQAVARETAIEDGLRAIETRKAVIKLGR